MILHTPRESLLWSSRESLFTIRKQYDRTYFYVGLFIKTLVLGVINSIVWLMGCGYCFNKHICILV